MFKFIEMIADTKEWLKGKKVYLISLSGILAAVLAWTNDTISTQQLIEAVYAGVVAIAFAAKVDRKLEGTGIKVLVLAALLGLFTTPLNAYSFGDFVTDLNNDTRAVIGKELQTTYFYDCLEPGSSKSKVGASSPILAWKFISVNPAFIYTPDAADSKGEVGLTFPIRLMRIPLPALWSEIRAFWIPTAAPQTGTAELIDRLYLGPYFSHNFITGKFGVGVNAGVKFF